MKSGRIFWGLAFVLCAVCIIFNKSPLFGDLSIWTAIISIAGVAVCLEGLYRLSVGKVIFGGAVLLCVWKAELGLADLSIWTVFVASVLLAIGLSILLSPLKKKRDRCLIDKDAKKFSEMADHGDCNYNYNQRIRIERNFSGGVEYIRSNDFQRADIDVHFSGLKLYFDDATIQDNCATLHMDISFSGVEMYIPSEWAIDNRLDRTASNVEIAMNGRNIVATKTLKLKGDVNFGSLKIIYI